MIGVGHPADNRAGPAARYTRRCGGALIQINMPRPAIFSFDLPLESRAAQHFPQTYSLAGDAAVALLGRPLLMRHPAAATRKFLPRFAIVTVIVSGWRLGVA